MGIAGLAIARGRCGCGETGRPDSAQTGGFTCAVSTAGGDGGTLAVTLPDDAASPAHPRRIFNPALETHGKHQTSLWMIVRAALFRPSFHNWYGWRRLLLTMFGAKLGKNFRIRPTALVEIPWNLEADNNVVIGDYAIIYSLGKIKIGRSATISQYAHLCAGTHDYTRAGLPCLNPNCDRAGVWIAADAFVGRA